MLLFSCEFYKIFQNRFFAKLTLVLDNIENCKTTLHFLLQENLTLTLSWRRPLLYRNHSTDLLRKSMDWFLYHNGLRHGRVKGICEYNIWRLTWSSSLFTTLDSLKIHLANHGFFNICFSSYILPSWLERTKEH